MSSRQSAVDAVNIERGFAESPLKIKLLESEEKKASSSNFVASSQTSSDPFVSDPFNGFETLIMRRLRQEEERKRLIAEMMKQDAENDDWFDLLQFEIVTECESEPRQLQLQWCELVTNWKAIASHQCKVLFRNSLSRTIEALNFKLSKVKF